MRNGQCYHARAQGEGAASLRLKLALVLVLVGLLGTAWSTASQASSPGNLVGKTTAKAVHTAMPPVKPCKSSLTTILENPKSPVTNYLFTPATGATTPQAAIRKVVGSENGRGLIAMCPYITSEEVFDV